MMNTVSARSEAWQPRRIRNDLLVLPHVEEEVVSLGIPANCYVFTIFQHAVLVDTVFEDNHPALEAILAQGLAPVALVVTHRHVIGQAETLPALAHRLRIPVLLSRTDAASKQSRRWANFAYQDPFDHPLLKQLGIEVLSMPGHTEGHLMLYRKEGGDGLLVAGDCAVGPTTFDAAAGRWSLVRPPSAFNVDDEQLRSGWVKFERPVSTFCPYHGLPLVDKEDVIKSQIRSLGTAHSSNRLG